MSGGACCQESCECLRNLRHELNNLLAPMLGHLQQLLLGENDSGRRERLLRLETMVRGLARQLRSGQRVYTSQRLDCLLAEALEAFQAEQVEVAPEVRVHWYDISGDSQVVADGRQVRTMLINLLRNAARHPLPGHQLLIEVRAAAERAYISVVDGGPGLPVADPADLPAGFTTREGTGHGQGLALVQTAAGRHGTRLRSRRGADGRHRMEFHLPLLEPVAARAAERQELTIGSHGYSPAGA